MFDAQQAFRRGGQSWMLAPPGLHAGFLVGRDDKFIAFEGFAFPGTLLETRIRLALTAKPGSRGKIQLRWYQGRIASSWSHRQMVLPEMVATKPASQT